MSIRCVRFSQLTCDTCGAEWSEMHDSATLARINAARVGWRYAEYRRRPNGQKTVRSWDACPDCTLPGTPEDAQRLIDAKEDR